LKSAGESVTSSNNDKSGTRANDARKERLAEELRKNLLRRKAQARQRSAAAENRTIEPADDAADNASNSK
jgi:hypothetical protein